MKMKKGQRDASLEDKRLKKKLKAAQKTHEPVGRSSYRFMVQILEEIGSLDQEKVEPVQRSHLSVHCALGTMNRFKKPFYRFMKILEQSYKMIRRPLNRQVNLTYRLVMQLKRIGWTLNQQEKLSFQIKPKYQPTGWKSQCKCS